MRTRIEKRRMILIITTLGVLALGCQFMYNLFGPTDEPTINQPEEAVQVQPNEPEPIAPESAESEDEETPGEQNGAGPQENVGELIPLDLNGIQIFYDPEVILEIMPESIPFSAGEYYLPYPNYVRYQLLMDYGMLELVDVYALKNMAEVSGDEIDKLTAIINSQDISGLDCIPEVALEDGYTMCSHQQFLASVDFVDFQNGSGVRFVTVYAIQDYAPVSNRTLEYIFQGVSDNGDCYLKGTFEISHDMLEEDSEIPMDAYQDPSGQLMEEYFSDYVDLLDANPERYIPSLEYLDRIIESIAVGVCGRG